MDLLIDLCQETANGSYSRIEVNRDRFLQIANRDRRMREATSKITLQLRDGKLIALAHVDTFHWFAKKFLRLAGLLKELFQVEELITVMPPDRENKCSIDKLYEFCPFMSKFKVKD